MIERFLKRKRLKASEQKENQLGEVWAVIRMVSLAHLLLIENGYFANV